MTFPQVIPALLCLLPVLCFLTALAYLDSYKLVSPGTSALMMGLGMASAGLGFLANAALLQHLTMDRVAFTRYVSPLVEEALKGAIIVWLIRRHRIGFLADAAIFGFAVGCGFALVENVHAIWLIPDAGIPTWVVRGFGTAIMHGGATAFFAVVALAVLERAEHRGLAAALPGMVAAVLLHSLFNHLGSAPKVATLTVMVVVPALLIGAFHRSERALADWLGHGFDADTKLLELIRSGGLPDSPVGHYLRSLREHFRGAVVADLLCYLTLFTELALRAKGLLLMRENGFEATVDDETRARLEELKYLEASIGRTGLSALNPLLPMRRQALSQIGLLGA